MWPYALSPTIVCQLKEGHPILEASSGRAAPASLAHPLGQTFRSVIGEKPSQLCRTSVTQHAFNHGERTALRVQVFQQVLLKEWSQSNWNTGWRPQRLPVEHSYRMTLQVDDAFNFAEVDPGAPRQRHAAARLNVLHRAIGSGDDPFLGR